MGETLLIEAIVCFSLPVIPLYWLKRYTPVLSSDAQMELYLIIFCILLFTFTMGSYADWCVEFNASDWWFNFCDFTFAGDSSRTGVEYFLKELLKATIR